MLSVDSIGPQNEEPRRVAFGARPGLEATMQPANVSNVGLEVKHKNTFLEFGPSQDEVNECTMGLPKHLSRRRTTMTAVRRSGASERRVSFAPQVPVFFYTQTEADVVEEDGGEWCDLGADSDEEESSEESSEPNSDRAEATHSAEELGPQANPGLNEPELMETTVMIRNIPNKYTQARMLAVLLDRANAVGRFDYLYMPMDLRHKCNVGYGFINFRCPADAHDFKNRFCGFQLPDTKSKKIFEVSFAKTQGLEANVREVRGRAVSSSRPIPEEYRPMFFDEDMNFVAMPELPDLKTK